MKSRKSIILIITLFGLLACGNNDDGVDQSKIIGCDSRPEWQWFDADCGCFGTPFGFSGWCVPAKGGEITYFAKTNFHHIQDSLCLIYKPEIDEILIINVNNLGYHADELGTTIKKAIDRKWTLIYGYDDSDIKEPSEDLQKSESKIELDPNKFDAKADELRIMAFKYRTGVPGKVKLDSTEIVFLKQQNRR
jgi:hypothetical protein